MQPVEVVRVVLTAALTAGWISLCRGRIVFIQQPKNVTVSEGTDAFFPCSYRGTSGVPAWRINNDDFVTSALPPRHSYNGSGLVVSNVDLSVNRNSYTCFFTVYINGQFMDIKSNTGFLIIANGSSTITIHLKPSLSTRYKEPTVHCNTNSTTFIEPTVTILASKRSLDISVQPQDGRVKTLATEHLVPLTPMQLNLSLVIGIIVGVGISLLIAAVFITVVCVVVQRSRALKTTGLWKRKATDIKTRENVAYEIPPSRIKMTENVSYEAPTTRI